ncbi:MlaE family ABC transporter permease [Endozoicomonadaceae bacterium StTr2]
MPLFILRLMQTNNNAHWQLDTSSKPSGQESGVVTVELYGAWLISASIPKATELDELLTEVVSSCDEATIHLVPGAGFEWDTGFMSFLLQLHQRAVAFGVKLDPSRLPSQCCQLFELTTAVKPEPPSAPAARSIVSLSEIADLVKSQLYFGGEVTLAFISLLSGRARTRFADCLFFFQQTGPNAIPIITLISVLVGMILAYLGLVQLRQFGAQVYIADLVAIGMTREMGALMTAVILAGRTGAAYAAQLGTMQVNEEVDALVTLGIRPVEYLVLPRILALVAVMPLLTIYSDVLGIAGGALVAVGMDLTFTQFFHHISQTLSFHAILAGCFKSVIFGLLIAMAGCQAGMTCGRSSAAVGEATTRAVVLGIVYLVVADALLNIIYYKLGI